MNDATDPWTKLLKIVSCVKLNLLKSKTPWTGFIHEFRYCFGSSLHMGTTSFTLETIPFPPKNIWNRKANSVYFAGLWSFGCVFGSSLFSFGSQVLTSRFMSYEAQELGQELATLNAWLAANPGMSLDDIPNYQPWVYIVCSVSFWMNMILYIGFVAGRTWCFLNLIVFAASIASTLRSKQLSAQPSYFD